MKSRFTALTALASIALMSPFGTTAHVQAQEAGARVDTLTLGRLHEAALRHDARVAQGALNESALELRLRSLASEWLPDIRIRGEARYQSDVTRIEASAVEGDATPVEFPEVPKDRYEAALEVEQVLYDRGLIGGRRDVERARTIETQAHLATTLHELRREVDRAYFSAIALAAQSDEIALLIADLEARLGQARSGVESGVRLPGEAARIEAELLRARQRLDEVHGDRRAAISVLSNLSGDRVEEETVLPLPMLEAEVAATRVGAGEHDQMDGAPTAVRRHPVFDAFLGTAERLAREAELAGRERRPRVVAFGEAGYGRPGLNQFAEAGDTFWLGGVRVEWTPWSWGRIEREQQLLELRREAVVTEEEAFAASLDRAVADELADLDRIRDALSTDEDILRLRERIERQEERRFEEGVITAADYVDARTDLLQARVALRLHHIELAEVQARYLSTLGVPIP